MSINWYNSFCVLKIKKCRNLSMIEKVERAQDSKMIDFDKPVKVYFNFTKKVWSILQNTVKTHAKYVCLKNTKFHVSERGRQKVLSSKRKNVHAWIVGTIVQNPNRLYNADQLACRILSIANHAGHGSPWVKVTYNPYINTSFVEYGKAVTSARLVHMDSTSTHAKVLALI